MPHTATRSHRHTQPQGQQGSAYIITLMVLFMLTIVGLSLSLVTQTELLIGSQDRTIQRSFYAADSGMGTALSRVLIRGDYREHTFDVSEVVKIDDGSGTMVATGTELTDRVEVSRFVPLLDSYCNLCQINQGAQYFKINHAVSAVATRLSTDVGGGGAQVPLARSQVTAMYSISPWPRLTDAYAYTQASVQKVYF